MMPYLIEPYNAWDKTPKKKKHFHELIEEEQLMARIIAEQQAAQQQIQNTAMAAAGAGGVPPHAYFNPEGGLIDFSFLPAAAAGPVTFAFTNETPTQFGEVNNFLWIFGDGNTSTEENPRNFYSNTGSYDVELQVTNSLGQASASTQVVSASVPIVTAGWTATSASNIAPVTLSFTNTSTNNSYQPTSSYLWNFGNGVTSTLATLTSSVSFANTQSYTISLRHTGSYSSSLYSAATTAVAPTITAAFTLTTSSNVGPVTGTFLNTSANTALASIYRWDLGDGSPIETTIIPNPHLYNTGSFTASLQITSSHYANINSLVTRSFIISPATFVASFSMSLNSATAPATASFIQSSSYNGTGTLTYLWSYGSGSATTTAATASAFGYLDAGGYTASLAITESSYNSTRLFTRSFVLA